MACWRTGIRHWLSWATLRLAGACAADAMDLTSDGGPEGGLDGRIDAAVGPRPSGELDTNFGGTGISTFRRYAPLRARRFAHPSAVLIGTTVIALLLNACTGGSSTPPRPVGAYTVGGNITGLNGILVLRNNGADDLSVSANGAFAFKTALATTATYNATVAMQPAAQTCGMANGAGTIASANVTDVMVTCANASPHGTGGTLDTTFGAGGKVTTDFSGAPPTLGTSNAKSTKTGGGS